MSPLRISRLLAACLLAFSTLAGAQEAAPAANAETAKAATPAAENGDDKRQAQVLLQYAEDEKEAAKQRAIDAAKQREEDKKRQKQERERSCVVKPVMSDAEIANCKEVWAEPQPAAEKAPVKTKKAKAKKKAAAAAPSRTEANP